MHFRESRINPLPLTVMGACEPSGGDRGLTLASKSLFAPDVVLPPLSPFMISTPPVGACSWARLDGSGAASPTSIPPATDDAEEPGREEGRLSPPPPIATPPGATDGERSDRRPCTMSGSSSRRPAPCCCPWAPRPLPSAPFWGPLVDPMAPGAAAAALGAAASLSSSILFNVMPCGGWAVAVSGTEGGRRRTCTYFRIQPTPTTPAASGRKPSPFSRRPYKAYDRRAHTHLEGPPVPSEPMTVIRIGGP